MTFQAPYDVTDLMRVQLAERQMQQEQQQNQQENMQAMTSQVFDAMSQLAGSYAQNQQVKSDAKIYGDLLKFAGPAIGDTKGELLASYKKMDEREQANFGRTLFGGGLFPTMSQSYNFGRNAGIRENQPFVAADLQNRRNIAGGKTTYGNPSGLSSVEPDLPVGDHFLPPVRHGAGMQNNVTRFAPSQAGISAARNWSAGYFGKSNP